MMKIHSHPYTQLSVSGRSVRKEACYQKGIDNMLHIRINEHSTSTNPYYKVIHEIHSCSFPRFITKYIIYLHLFPMHCLLCSKLHIMGMKICV